MSKLNPKTAQRQHVRKIRGGGKAVKKDGPSVVMTRSGRYWESERNRFFFGKIIRRINPKV